MKIFLNQTRSLKILKSNKIKENFETKQDQGKFLKLKKLGTKIRSLKIFEIK